MTPRVDAGAPEEWSSSNISTARSRGVHQQSNYGNRRESLNSETSFESSDSQDETPPEDEDKQLSPVVESAESPISGLRYPKIPRSTNQLVARSSLSPAQSPTKPTSPRSIQEPSPLATQFAERRAENKRPTALQSIPRKPVEPSQKAMYLGSPSPSDYKRHRRSPNVYMGSPHYENDSNPSRPVTVHRRSVSAGNTQNVQPQHVGKRHSSREMQLKSPLWEPRLYPTKRGDELFFGCNIDFAISYFHSFLSFPFKKATKANFL